jgi:hypothetical protein
MNVARKCGHSTGAQRARLTDLHLEVNMDGRYDYDDEDVMILKNYEIEPTCEGMDVETAQILMEDRVATGG